MVPNLTPTHHPFLHGISNHNYLLILLLCIMAFIPVGTSQEISDLELVRTLHHNNYSVQTLDSYFENGRQLIAYTNISGTDINDTLIIYDFETDQTLLSRIADSWYFTLDFVNSNQLLFSNSGKLYRISNFNPPTTSEIQDGVRTFKLSADNSTIAILKNGGTGNLLEVSTYNSNTGSISSTETFDFADLLDNQVSEIAFSPDAQYIAINGGYDKDYVVIINRSTNDITTINTPVNQGTYSPAFYESSGNLYLAVGGGYLNGNIEIIDIASLSLETSIPAFNFYNYAIAYDNAMEYVVTGGYDGILKLYHVTGTDYNEITSETTGNVNEVIFTEDNNYVLAALGPSNADLNIYRIVRGGTATDSPVEIEDGLYPNPAYDVLMVKSPYPSMNIFDSQGRSVIQLAVNATSHDISALPPGSYYIKAIGSHGAQLMRFIKL